MTTAIQKADLAIADLQTAGRLDDTQSAEFLQTIIDQPTILNQARVVQMPSDTYKINKIGFGSRILRKAPNEGTALAAGKRSKPDLGQVKMTAEELIAEVHLPYKVIEDNIEGGNIRGGLQSEAGGIMSTLLKLIAERVSLDLEEYCLLGDKANTTDEFLGMQDGWLKQASANILTLPSGYTLARPVFKDLVKTLPSKYFRNPALMRYFMSTDNAIEASEIQGLRATALGDAKTTGFLPTQFHGVRVEGNSFMPESNMLLTNPKNLILGLHREIFIEFQKNIRTRMYEIVVTTRVATAIEEKNAMAKAVVQAAPKTTTTTTPAT